MEYQLLSDELLVKLLRVDDEGAFREIYKRYLKLLTKMALNKLKSSQEAEEILQETFLHLWEKRATQNVENLKAYLFTSLKYQIIDHYKAKILAERYADFVFNKDVQPENSSESEMNFQEIITLFENALHNLPQKTSQIFRMSRLENKTTREISEALQVPERTVEYHITQSLKLLRVQLKDFLPASIIAILSSF